MIYIPGFIEIGSGVEKLMVVGIHRHTDNGSRISRLKFIGFWILTAL
jgi:hypothetical protein